MWQRFQSSLFGAGRGLLLLGGELGDEEEEHDGGQIGQREPEQLPRVLRVRRLVEPVRQVHLDKQRGMTHV